MSMLGTETVTITPQTAALVDGVWQLTPGSSYTVTGTVLPVPGAVLQRLSEGARRRAVYVLYVEGNPTINTTETASPSTPADRAARANGETYVVSTNLDLSIHGTGLPHRQYILDRVAGDE